MPVVTRHSSRYMRLILAATVALALMPACIMLVCTTMDIADPSCVEQPLSLIDPATSAGGLMGVGGFVQSLLLAFVAFAAAVVTVRFSGNSAVVSSSHSDGRTGPIPPPLRGTTPLVI